MENKKRVILGMSGGTDSSVSAILLQQQGYEVIGITLRLWSNFDNFENTEEPSYITEAKNLASKLSIEHHVVDAKEQFYSDIVGYFKDEYLKGNTPNPCAKCNVVLKWKLLNDAAIRYNCQHIATGHYVQIIEEHNKFFIKKGIDPDKEQSFFLWGLDQEILSKAVFPLGNLTKTQAREIAVNNGFKKVATKKESIGVCFIEDGKYQPFLKKLMFDAGTISESGQFIDSANNILGTHQGYPFYTVGQRRGLGLSPNEPWYVTNINPKTNQITLGKREHLYQKEMIVQNYNFIDINLLKQKVITRIRYRKQAALSTVQIIDDKHLKVIFEDQEWSIAPGQTAAFYIDDVLIGGGFIRE